MDGGMQAIIQGEQRPLPQLKRLVNKLLPLQTGRAVPRTPQGYALM
jgi:hypothetical protein